MHKQGKAVRAVVCRKPINTGFLKFCIVAQEEL